MKNGGAVGGEWGETVIVRGGGGKEVEVEVEEEEEEEGGLWGVKVKRARCLGIFQFLRPVWCFSVSPAVSLALFSPFLTLLPRPPKKKSGGRRMAGGRRSAKKK